MERDALIGEVLLDRYVVDALIGEGGTSRIYRCFDPVVGNQVALKVLFGEAAASPRWRLRMQREVESLKYLVHPNIVQVLRSGAMRGGIAFYIMELVRGPTIHDVITRGGPVSLQLSLRIAR